MTKYRVKVRSFINHSMVEEGAIVDFDGVPASNLEPIEEGPKPPTEKAHAALDLKRQQFAAKGGDVNDQEAFEIWLAEDAAAKGLVASPSLV